jgi:hypothetical protein
MKRAAIIFAVVAGLLFADGIYLQVSNNSAGCGCNGDSGSLFGGSTNIALSTGSEVLIGAGFLLLVAIIIWIWATLRDRSQATGGSGAGTQPAAGQPRAKTQVAAAQGQPRKESGDQH